MRQRDTNPELRRRHRNVQESADLVPLHVELTFLHTFFQPPLIVYCTYSLLLNSHLSLKQVRHVAHRQYHMVHASLQTHTD